MRTLRLSLSGMVILALLGGLGGATAAETESDAPVSDESALLSFTMPYGARTGEQTTIAGRGLTMIRDVGVMTFIVSGDPRLDGTLWMVWNWDEFDDSGGNVVTGVAGVDHADGAWRGTLRGYFTPGREQRYAQIDLTGHGTYQGLSAILLLVDGGNASDFDVEGMVFPGEPPPVPELPAE